MQTIIAPESVTMEQRRELARPARGPDGRFIRKPQHPHIRHIWKWATSIYENNQKAQLFTQFMGTAAQRDLEPANKLYAESMRHARRWNRLLENSTEHIRIDQTADKAYRSFERLQRSIAILREQASYRVASYVPQRPKLLTCKISDIFNDMLNLCRVVPILWNGTEKCLQFNTEPISLIDPNDPAKRYNFGSFSIRFGLDIKTIFDIKIVANSPRLARGTTTEVTHPHVQSKRLCYGTGQVAAEKAFVQGRFFDITDLILGVLRNYGATRGQRPFQRLEQWNGVCDERFDPVTGLTVPMDTIVLIPVQRTTCRFCDAEVAVAQIHHCSYEGCSHEGCPVCIEPCAGSAYSCTNRLCDDHYLTCAECERHFCEYCFNHGGDLCIWCAEARETEESENEDEDEEEESEE